MTRNQLITLLATMHTYCRPAGSSTECLFIDRYISNLPGAYRDTFGNWHVEVSSTPVLWSCHTDTVHRAEGMQTVSTDRGILKLSRRSRRTSSCLGADDTVGVFLCREMVLAGVPGHYVFHFGEEKGCLGSKDLAHYNPDDLSRFQYAIAFDRAGTSDVITHQMSTRTCSDLFAESFADTLNTAIPSFFYVPCDRGVYTDTESYMRLIPECTNVSVGYESAHSSYEYVDIDHVLKLRMALVSLSDAEIDTWIVDRDPKAVDVDEYAYLFTDWGKYDSDMAGTDDNDNTDTPLSITDNNNSVYLDPEWERVQRHFEKMDRRNDR